MDGQMATFLEEQDIGCLEGKHWDKVGWCWL